MKILIKEVADVTFYELGSTGKPTNPVLYLDTLKVSTIEQTGETAEARGGKGNAPLIMWDFGKEINVTLEDALFSAKSMAIMFGNGRLKGMTKGGANDAGINNKTVIMKTEQFVATDTALPTVTSGVPSTDTSGWKYRYEAPDGTLHVKYNPKFYDEKGTPVSSAFTAGNTYFCSYDLEVVNGSVIEISANSFPGSYYVTGDTFARSEASGKDEFFQFVIPKAKITSENTITLEAEGDPSVFNLNLRVLRPIDGKMMQLIKYSLPSGTAASEAETATVVHNHNMTTPAAG